MRLRPYSKRVLISPADQDALTRGGVILPPNAREPVIHGIVLAVGKRVRDVIPTDTVYYNRYAVTELEADGRLLVMAVEADIIARVEGGA